MVTEIKTGTPYLTLVNVFETTQETQKQLLEVLKKATAEAMSTQPGFISANFHASRDGVRVVNYAQWESVTAFEAMLKNPECLPHRSEAESICKKKPDVHPYDVIATFGPHNHTSTTEIRTGTSYLTLVNVYSTTHETQPQVVEVANEMVAQIIVKQPGFVSGNFHTSRDGLRIVNYAQWASIAAFEGMVKNPACLPYMQKIENLCSQKPDIHFYDVIATYGSSKRLT